MDNTENISDFPGRGSDLSKSEFRGMDLTEQNNIDMAEQRRKSMMGIKTKKKLANIIGFFQGKSALLDKFEEDRASFFEKRKGTLYDLGKILRYRRDTETPQG